MYRFYSALGVLAAVLVLGIGGFFVNTEAAERLSGTLNDAYALAKDGDMTG